MQNIMWRTLISCGTCCCEKRFSKHMSSLFTNKVVIITGSASGIGAQTALDFASLGASLSLADINEKNLEATAKQCADISPTKLSPLTIKANMGNEADVENIIKKTIDKYKKIDVLVNNAGIFGTGSIEQTSLQQFDKIMDINVRSVYQLTMLAVPHLLKSKGNIVNLSSICGLRSFPNVLAYCISKTSIDQFTKCVALELGAKGVRVNAVSPGVIVTALHLSGGMSQEDYDAYKKKCAETHPIGRTGEPKEVSAAITFLASDAASNITAVNLPVDGGKQALCPR